MAKERRNYPEIAPSGPTYSRVVRSGNLVFIAGCTARGAEAQGRSLMDQLRVTLDRITRIVAAEGGEPGDITKITTFVTSIADWRSASTEQEKIFQQYFQGDYPANSLIEISALAEAGLNVEIEAIAVIDS